jgi:hypothetical protein
VVHIDTRSQLLATDETPEPYAKPTLFTVLPDQVIGTPPDPVPLTREQREALEALGYVDAEEK